jgi:hypothetical protein
MMTERYSGIGTTFSPTLHVSQIEAGYTKKYART